MSHSRQSRQSDSDPNPIPFHAHLNTGQSLAICGVVPQSQMLWLGPSQYFFAKFTLCPDALHASSLHGPLPANMTSATKRKYTTCRHAPPDKNRATDNLIIWRNFNVRFLRYATVQTNKQMETDTLVTVHRLLKGSQWIENVWYLATSMYRHLVWRGQWPWGMRTRSDRGSAPWVELSTASSFSADSPRRSHHPPASRTTRRLLPCTGQLHQRNILRTECPATSLRSVSDKYQLSLVDPRDRIVLQTDLDDHPWKTTAVERRSSEVLST